MSENTSEQTIAETPVSPASTGVDTAKKTDDKAPAFRGRSGARRSFGGKKPNDRKGSRFQSERPKPEFEQKIINISRVTRVVKGGRRLSFRVDMIIGDKKGRIGLGSGKATDTSLAIQKAFAQARKKLIKVNRTKNNSLEHSTRAKITASEVEMMPNKGRGLVAGSTMRTVLELAGITDITGRILSRSKNKLNNAKATIQALRIFEIPLPKEEKKFEPENKGRRFNNNNRGGRTHVRRAPAHQ